MVTVKLKWSCSKARKFAKHAPRKQAYSGVFRYSGARCEFNPASPGTGYLRVIACYPTHSNLSYVGWAY